MAEPNTIAAGIKATRHLIEIAKYAYESHKHLKGTLRDAQFAKEAKSVLGLNQENIAYRHDAVSPTTRASSIRTTSPH